MTRVSARLSVVVVVASAHTLGCTTVTVDMRAQTAGDEAHTTIVYSGKRGGDARFADYGAIEGSILDD